MLKLFDNQSAVSGDPNDHVNPDLLSHQPTQFGSRLAALVCSSFREAHGHKQQTGVAARIQQDLHARLNKYDPEFCAHIEPGTDVYIPLTSTKCRAAESWIRDILANAEDRPWVLKGTPSPELPPDMEEAVLTYLEAEFIRAGAPVNVEQRAAELKDLAREIAVKLNAERVSNMETVIHDQLTEGFWRKTFDAFVRDLCTYEAAFVKGPVMRPVERLSWTGEGDHPVEVREILPILENVSPERIYPSPDMSDIQTGAYIIEERPLTASQLLKLAEVPAVDEYAMRAAIAQHMSGPMVPDGVPEMDNARGIHMDPSNATRFHQLLMYYGRVPGAILKEHGLDVDPQYEYESEVWVVGAHVVRALLNPYPLRRRPFYKASFIEHPGSLWGTSLPGVLRDIQRTVNGMARSLVKNTAFSSGPFIEMVVSLLENEEDVTKVEPWRVYQTRPGGTSQGSAIRPHQVQNIATQLANLMQFYFKMADDVSGIPAYVLGNPDVAGAGRTLGGLSLLMGNAAKGIKMVIGNFDRGVMEPVVGMFYNFNLLYNPDRSIKADATPVARGASGLLQKELSSARTSEVLQLLAPFVGNLVPAPGYSELLRDFLRQNGQDPDRIIPNLSRDRDLQVRASQLQGTIPSLQPGTPAPALDGRSAAAARVIGGQIPAPVTES